MNYALVTVINLVIEFFSLMILIEVVGLAPGHARTACIRL